MKAPKISPSAWPHARPAMLQLHQPQCPPVGTTSSPPAQTALLMPSVMPSTQATPRMAEAWMKQATSPAPLRPRQPLAPQASLSPVAAQAPWSCLPPPKERDLPSPLSLRLRLSNRRRPNLQFPQQPPRRHHLQVASVHLHRPPRQHPRPWARLPRPALALARCPSPLSPRRRPAWHSASSAPSHPLPRLHHLPRQFHHSLALPPPPPANPA